MPRPGQLRGSLKGAAALGVASVGLWLAGQRFRPQIGQMVLATGHRIDLARLGCVLINRPAVSAFGQPDIEPTKPNDQSAQRNRVRLFWGVGFSAREKPGF